MVIFPSPPITSRTAGPGKETFVAARPGVTKRSRTSIRVPPGPGVSRTVRVRRFSPASWYGFLGTYEEKLLSSDRASAKSWVCFCGSGLQPACKHANTTKPIPMGRLKMRGTTFSSLTDVDREPFCDGNYKLWGCQVVCCHIQGAMGDTGDSWLKAHDAQDHAQRLSKCFRCRDAI
jgi:hypothetical protein